MCGIAAIIQLPGGTGTPAQGADLERMRDLVEHRGPDDSGLELFDVDPRGRLTRRNPDPAGGNDHAAGWQVGLAHRRLSILDLREHGRQPFTYEGRYWIVYNGEVYNYLELREELRAAGHGFSTNTDTEVVLAAFAAWGPACFAKMRGMWGLAIVDTEAGTITLSRDRMGIKPLYLWQNDGVLAVASEIKQFRAIPSFSARLNTSTAALYLTTGYESTEQTLFDGVLSFPPGRHRTLRLSDLKTLDDSSYWNPASIEVEPASAREVTDAFANHFDEAVALRLRSDVRLGCALSGGLDSSAVAATIDLLRQPDQNAALDQRVDTFTITFPNTEADELVHASAVAARIRSHVHLATPTAERFLDELDRLVWIHDEPLGSFSPFAQYCLAQLIKEAGVTVTLNGQGGDELFTGYWQLFYVFLWAELQRGSAVELCQNTLGALLPGGNEEFARQVPVMARRFLSRRRTRQSLPFSGVLKGAASAAAPSDVLSGSAQDLRLAGLRKMFLPRYLKWEDRNTMAFSVEGRYPFLDHELIEAMLRAPQRHMFHRGWTKWPLRQAMRHRLPKSVVFRKDKMGFETPSQGWLGGPLKSLLDEWTQQDRPLWDCVDRDHVARQARLLQKKKAVDPLITDEVFRLFFFDRWAEVFEVPLSV